MKFSLKILLISLWAILVIVLVTIITLGTPIKVGQIWTKIDNKNPYNPPKFDTIIIIDIKGDYSKVIKNGDTTSIENELITCCGRRLMKKI